MQDFFHIHKGWRDPVPGLSRVFLLITAALLLEYTAVLIRNQAPQVPPAVLLTILRTVETMVFLSLGPWSLRNLFTSEVLTESLLLAVICSLAGILFLVGWKWVLDSSFLSSGSNMFRQPMVIPILFYTTACIISPIAEELLFRGLLYRKMREKWGFVVCTLAVSMLFALIHFSLLGSIMSVLMPFMGSLLFCAGYEKTKSILTPVLLHICGNSIIYLSPLISFV